jgi:hypothetical protein
MTHTFEYVASGLSYFQILNIVVHDRPEIQYIINQHFARINGLNNSKFSLLYNAFTEQKFGGLFYKMYRNSIYKVHADSGGLQIITQGKKMTPELRDVIYRQQAKYSDIAMCFDEIPIKVTGEKSKIGDTDSRTFDTENLEHYARATGKNIRRQLEVFADEKTKSQPMLIVQGNCYDSFMKWTEFVVKEIPTELHQYIAGVAIAGSSLGSGYLEDIERVAYIPYLPFETKYAHILGVGSAKRMLPLIALLRSGYFPKDYNFSYDSTSHTMGLAVGRYYIDNGIIQIFRHLDKNYLRIYNDMNTKYGLERQKIDMKKFHKIINSAGEYYTQSKKYVDNLAKEYYNVKVGFVCSMIDNFTKTIDDCYKSEKYLLDVANRYRVLIETNALLKIKTLGEFQNWEKEYGKHVHSRRISNVELSTLESFM